MPRKSRSESRSHHVASPRADHLARYGCTARDALRLASALDIIESKRRGIVKALAEVGGVGVTYDTFVAAIRRIVDDERDGGGT